MLIYYIITSYDHNHAPDRTSIEIRRAINKMKKTAKSSNEVTGVIVSDNIATVSDAAAVDLSNKSCLNRTVQRQRAKNNPQLTNPVDRVDLVISNHFSTNQNGKKFLLHDSGGKNRYLLFSTQTNLRFLSNCEVWMADGTFNQLYFCNYIRFMECAILKFYLSYIF